MTPPVQVVFPESVWRDLHAHLFPGGDVVGEHGAVLSAGVARSGRGTRLLVRDLFVAEDSRDYLAGKRGHRMLSADFVRNCILKTRDMGLAYLAVHNHGRGHMVDFSTVDMASHDRGYPALLDLNRGQPVGALVLATEALAGDIWWADGSRTGVAEAVVVGSRVGRRYQAPRPKAEEGDLHYSRQTLVFGQAGQATLSRLKVGVIGAGGVGALLVEYLARLGVGHLVVADPDRVEHTNLPRLVGARMADAGGWLTEPSRPTWLRRLARRLARPKVRIARRSAVTASPRMRFEGIEADFVNADVACRFTDCDFLFLAADSFQARLVFNAMVHQYLIPGIQVGAKVRADRDTGAILDIYAVSRTVLPDYGCLWCNELIPPARLQDEAATESERRRQRYVDDPLVNAPSVITLNALAAAQAANDFLFMMTGLADPTADNGYRIFRPAKRQMSPHEPRRDAGCLECGLSRASRRARGDAELLPTRGVATG